MTFLRSALALFFIFSLLTTAEAQLNRLMSFDTYQVEDGLAGNWVGDLVQDRDGNMWISTSEGLSKYDGYSFQNYRSDAQDSTTISTDLLTAIAMDSTGNIWVKSIFGLDLYDPTRDQFQRFPFTRFTENTLEGNPSSRHKSFFCASDGTLYSNAPGGMIRFHHEKGESHYYAMDTLNPSGLRSAEVSDFVETADGKILVSGEAGIDILDPISGKWSSFDQAVKLPTDIVKLCLTKDQVLWIAGDEDIAFSFSDFQWNDTLSANLLTIDLKTGDSHHYTYRPSNRRELLGQVSQIIEDRNGTVWITRYGGAMGNLFRHIAETKTFQTYGYEANNPSSIAWNYATALVQDRSKDLWVGTSRGLSKSNSFKSQFNTFAWVPGKPFDFGNLIYNPTEIALDQILVIGDDDGIARVWDKNTKTSKTFELDANLDLFEYDSVFTNSIWTAWVNTHLRQVYASSLTYKDYNNPSAEKNWFILDVLPLSSDSLLLSTDDGFWYFTLSNKKFVKIALNGPNDNLDNGAYFQTVHLNADTYISFRNSENDKDVASNIAEINLVEFDLASKKILKTYTHILSEGVATRGPDAIFFMDRAGKVWIAGTNRMICFDPATEQFKEYPGEMAYNGRQVVSAFEDFDSYIWFNSTEQVSRLDPKTGEIQSINKTDGLITFRLNPQSSMLTRKGDVIFAGVGGITYFDPRTFKTPSDLPNIVISYFLAGENKINVKGTQQSGIAVEIPSDHRSIDIEFKSISFRNAALTTYRYKLEGWQDDWQDAGTRRFVQFTNLPPGKYTFMVSATNSNGLESAAAATISFNVLPPWWRTWWAYVGYIVAFALIIFAIDKAMRRRLASRQKEKDRQKELAQAKEIEKAYHSLEEAHKELKGAQQQLVQQEKLASLGQLTAGIAHEIKNPLNFVNNFSELNIEMVDEAMAELDGLPGEKADPIKELLTDVRANLQKILQHGTRADGIVKSMLQHSRGGSEKKEPTDLNMLLQEYVNLAFHGMRASKNPINVKLNFLLDGKLGMVNLIGEDFSRVVLNIANNAFDALRDKARTEPDYKPELTVRSKRNGEQVEISIADNGPGIPDAIKDKILQPFFTTKKGTEGTGLGLSITNDIIKAHGGTLDIQSKPGQTVFQIII